MPRRRDLRDLTPQPQEILVRFGDFADLDRRLYQHASELFQARVAERGEAFQAALRRFRFWNGVRCSWRARLNRIRQTLRPS